MKGRLILVVLLVVVVAAVVAVAPLTFVPPSYASPGGEVCGQYGIRFDTSSIEALYLDPEAVLADPEAFWARDPAYQLAAQHYEAHGLPIPMEAWQRRLEAIASWSPEKRARQQPLRIARSLIAGQPAFCEQAVPHVLAFLPEGTSVATTIYLTALTDAYVPYVHPRMAVDTSHSSHILFTGLVSLPRQVFQQPAGSWADMRARGSASTIFNTLVHELFHAGYWQSAPLPEGYWDPVLEALVGLQNEGMAVYVAHEAESLFPAPLESDFHGSQAAVRRQLHDLNELLAGAGSLPEDELRSRLTEVGFRDKAFYRVGSYMAETIDQALGREALVRTISEGPCSFVRTYNRVTGEDVRIWIESEEGR
jgi:hypothetical protein